MGSESAPSPYLYGGRAALATLATRNCRGAEGPANLPPYLQKIRVAVATLSSPAAQGSTRQLILYQPQREAESCTDLLNSLVAKLSKVIRNHKTSEPKIIPAHTDALQERPALRNPFMTSLCL